MRVVVDTNVLMSGIFWGGKPGRIIEAWAAGLLVLVVSAKILEEYFEVLDRIAAKMKREDLAARWKTPIFEHCEMVTPTCKYGDCRDPDDTMFVECAVSGGVQYLVSGDEDLLVLGRVQDVNILTPAQFVEILKI